MEVDRGRFGELVLEVDPHAVAFAYADLRAGELTVVGPCLDGLPRLVSHWIFLAVRSKTFTPFSMRGCHHLVALSGGLCRETP